MTSDRFTMLANLVHFAMLATITMTAVPPVPSFENLADLPPSPPIEPYVPPERVLGPPPKRINKGTRRGRKAAREKNT